MANNIENFTAPGKYFIDLSMEQTARLLKEGRTIQGEVLYNEGLNNRKTRYNKMQNK